MKLLEYLLSDDGIENFSTNDVTSVTSVTLSAPAEPMPEPLSASESPERKSPQLVTEPESESKELALLGAERGYLTLDDMPELQRRLELAGWKVERHYDQLICWTPGRRKPRVQ
jgi:hypothetical protein